MGGGDPPLAPTGLGENALGEASPFPEGDVDTATGDPAHAPATRSAAANWHNRLDLSPTQTAVILAAGHGTRMRSRIPKVLHPICGRPLIDWVLEAVNEAGAKHVTVIANPHHADVAAHLDGRVELVYQRDPRGTAHALQHIPAGELRGRRDPPR